MEEKEFKRHVQPLARYGLPHESMAFNQSRYVRGETKRTLYQHYRCIQIQAL
jgi:hypothetical protein